jgi:hypothetical protein
MRKSLILLAALVISVSSFAMVSKTIDAKGFVVGMKTAINEAMKTSPVPVLFPSKVAADTQHDHYYASNDEYAAKNIKGYQINVDYKQDCKGAHYCTVGYIRGQQDAQPEILKDRNNKIITEDMRLTTDIQGFYTPGHAMGSYFSPMLQWHMNGVLYTLSWDDHVASKEAMFEMANSVIDNLKK